MKCSFKISEAEYKIMEVIWENYPINTNDITNKLIEKTKWNEKTIHTLISRLAKKGVISYIKEGRQFVYSPAFDKQEYLNQQNKSFLNKFYNGTLNLMVMNFMQKNKLSKQEIEELKKILDNKKEY